MNGTIISPTTSDARLGRRLYILVGIISTFGEGGYVRRRTTVSRDGTTTTTVEEG